MHWIGLVVLKTSSAKAKGRNLQKYIRDYILKLYPDIPMLDVSSRPMGSQGSDVIMSAAAKDYFPYKIECKNQEAFSNVYKAFEQASSQKEDGEPLLIIKRNRSKPLAVVDLDEFMRLVKNDDGAPL